MHIAFVLSFLVIPLVSCLDALRAASFLDGSFEFGWLLDPWESKHAGGHTHAHRRISQSLQARAAPLPLGWSSQGCFSDRYVAWGSFILWANVP
jgi:hypothetical protein